MRPDGRDAQGAAQNEWAAQKDAAQKEWAAQKDAAQKENTMPTGRDLLDALKAKQFHGTIDRLKRGEIDEAQAQGELDGTRRPAVTTPTALNPADFAAELKERGVGRSESWSRWIQRTGLNPGMDAKDWYQIYDAVTA